MTVWPLPFFDGDYGGVVVMGSSAVIFVGNPFAGVIEDVLGGLEIMRFAANYLVIIRTLPEFIPFRRRNQQVVSPCRSRFKPLNQVR